MTKHRIFLHLQAADFDEAIDLWSALMPTHWRESLNSISLGLDCSSTTIQPQALPPINQVRNLLGQSTDMVIVNAFAGFNPNQFAMLAGTVRGGGYIVLMSPPSQEWAQCQDADYVKVMTDEEQRMKGKRSRIKD